MRIVCITGTEWKGCTWHIKEAFLAPLRASHEITEYTLPRDMPHFCSGCKLCWQDELLCPHAADAMPVWNAILAADLIVFAAPVYALRAPGQVKALLDHFACHMMPHRPDPRMFRKRAVILSNSIGAPNGGMQKDITASLIWWGISDIRRLGFGLMEGAVWEKLSSKRQQAIQRKTLRLMRRYGQQKTPRKGLKVRLYFLMSKTLHAILLRKEEALSPDSRHWIAQGWLNPKKETA